MKIPIDSSEAQQRDRIQRLKNEIHIITGGQAIFGTATNCPLDIEEAFLRRVLEYERDQSPAFRRSRPRLQ